MAELYSVCSVAELFISAEAESLLNHLTVPFSGPTDGLLTSDWAMEQ